MFAALLEQLRKQAEEASVGDLCEDLGKLLQLPVVGTEERILRKRMEQRFAKTADKVLVPYDAEGKRVEADGTGAVRGMWLDLQDRAEVRLTDGHNCRGSDQPSYRHIGAKGPVKGKQPALVCAAAATSAAAEETCRRLHT